MNRLLKIVFKIFGVIILFVLFVASLFYINTTIYNFPTPEPFSGKTIFNPYQNLPQKVYRANFHAHSVAWEGVTNGHNTEKDLFDAYTKRGYDIAGISNYHKISSYAKPYTDLYVPVYEHGYNIFKSHCLAINSEKVSYFDYPLFQLKSHKQQIINNIKDNGAYVSMAHPKFAGGRTFEDMRYLVGYDFTEVLNHYRKSEEYWDEALSAGRLTWIMGNDDTHDIIKEATFRIWNMIYSSVRHPDSIMKSMQIGKNYAISTNETQICDNYLKSCNLDGSNICLELTNPADSILFIGQKGIVKHRAFNTHLAEYKFQPEDTYIRIVAYNKNSQLYLNPILRIKENVPLNTLVKAHKNSFLTWFFRFGIIILSISLLFLLVKIIRS